MHNKLLFLPLSALLLSGCETLQTPQQRRQADARQQASTRHTEERIRRLQGQIETVEMENARLMQEVQQLRNDLRSFSGSVSQLNGSMKSLETKQAREMNELIKRVEALLKKSVAARASSSGRPANTGPGREHVVQPGHTLSAIAQAYGTTVKAIKQANNLKSDSIRVGQTLFIPE
jgi:LysM repeat protein